MGEMGHVMEGGDLQFMAAGMKIASSKLVVSI